MLIMGDNKCIIAALGIKVESHATKEAHDPCECVHVFIKPCEAKATL